MSASLAAPNADILLCTNLLCNKLDGVGVLGYISNAVVGFKMYVFFET